MKFLVDAQLPPGLCQWLGRRGFEAVHVHDLGMGAASDKSIAARAEAENFILLTKDEDFILLRLPDRFALLWLRCGNTTNTALAEWLEARWAQAHLLLVTGERMIELR